MRRGFTLIELLIVIGIIAILSTVVLLTLNPTELLKQSRDSTRIAELTSLDKAIGFASTQNPDLVLGAANTVYVSLPDTSATCATYVAFLPPLAPTWQYRCVTTANLRKLDGNGWLPINFTSLSIVPLDALAVDRSNNAQLGFYYTYAFQGTRWEFNADMESTKYRWGGGADVESNDGGNTTVLFEKGSSLLTMPNEANWRIGYITRVPESCAAVIGGTLYGNQEELYPRWSGGTSGQAAVVKIMFWDRDAKFDVGESVAMAIYNDGSPNYSKISEDLVLDGVGVSGWVSSTLSIPIAINLSSNYVIGMAISDASMAIGRIEDQVPLCSPPTTGAGAYYTTPSDQKLNPTVPTINPISTRSPFVGIMYSL